MTRRQNDLPTDSELEILSVLWHRGPSTVREVYRELQSTREIGYSTVLKFMQIMTAKKSLVRNATVRPQVYRPARSQRQTQQGIVRDLASRAFGGSPGNLALQALSSKKATAEERRRIRELLDQIEDKTP